MRAVAQAHRQGALAGGRVGGDVAQVVDHQQRGRRGHPRARRRPRASHGTRSSCTYVDARGGHEAEEHEHEQLAEAGVAVGPRPARVEPAGRDAAASDVDEPPRVAAARASPATRGDAERTRTPPSSPRAGGLSPEPTSRTGPTRSRRRCRARRRCSRWRSSCRSGCTAPPPWRPRHARRSAPEGVGPVEQPSSGRSTPTSPPRPRGHGRAHHHRHHGGGQGARPAPATHSFQPVGGTGGPATGPLGVRPPTASRPLGELVEVGLALLHVGVAALLGLLATCRRAWWRRRPAAGCRPGRRRRRSSTP